MSIFVPNKVYLRGILLHYFIQKKSAAEAHRILVQTYGDTALSDTTCRDWFRRFKNNDFELEDIERSGLLKLFNSYHERLRFTVDFKEPNSGRYLNYYSNLLVHKRGIIIGQLDRILFLSHPKFQGKNISDLVHTLLMNGYPLEFIFSTIKNRIKTLENRTNLDKNSECNNNESDSNSNLYSINKEKVF
ncbi:MOS1T transposase, partial [Pseudoatta argentina]